MKTRLKCVITITQEYDADTKDYFDCDYVEDMIEIDKNNFEASPMVFLDSVLDADPCITIEITEVRGDQ